MFKKHPKPKKEEPVKAGAKGKGKVVAPAVVEKDTKSKKESI
jgi:hypothetical protein